MPLSTRFDWNEWHFYQHGLYRVYESVNLFAHFPIGYLCLVRWWRGLWGELKLFYSYYCVRKEFEQRQNQIWVLSKVQLHISIRKNKYFTFKWTSTSLNFFYSLIKITVNIWYEYRAFNNIVYNYHRHYYLWEELKRKLVTKLIV